MTGVCLFLCVVGPGFDSTFPVFVRSRPNQEKLCVCITEWRDVLLGKGQDMNTVKYIVMVGRRAVVWYSEVYLWCP